MSATLTPRRRAVLEAVERGEVRYSQATGGFQSRYEGADRKRIADNVMHALIYDLGYVNGMPMGKRMGLPFEENHAADREGPAGSAHPARGRGCRREASDPAGAQRQPRALLVGTLGGLSGGEPLSLPRCCTERGRPERYGSRCEVRPLASTRLTGPPATCRMVTPHTD